MTIVQLHDRDFVMTYFPHLLQYQVSVANKVRYYLYRLVVGIGSHISDAIIRLLPVRLGYIYFKAMNVLAMRLGRLSFVLGRTVW